MFVLFLLRHFVEKPVVASRNIGCFLRLQIWGPMQGIDFRTIYGSQEYVSRDNLGFVNKDICRSVFFYFRNYYKALFSRNKCLLVHKQRMGSFVRLQNEASFSTLRSVYRLILSSEKTDFVTETNLLLCYPNQCSVSMGVVMARKYNIARRSY